MFSGFQATSADDILETDKLVSFENDNEHSYAKKIKTSKTRFAFQLEDVQQTPSKTELLTKIGVPKKAVNTQKTGNV